LRNFFQIIVALYFFFFWLVSYPSIASEESTGLGSLRGKELYMALRTFMDERNRLWFAPPPEANRDIDVSATVCPMVDNQKLTELLGAGPYGIRSRVLTDDPVAPSGTRLWEIPGHKSWFDHEFLFIWIGDEYCLAQYRHTK
jgi:hypothetical protein